MGIVDEFFELQDKTDAELLAMQVGDFYEFFADDARTASDELGLKLSEKSSHGSSYAMSGVPKEDIQQYVNTLVESKGYTVAIAEQYLEDGTHKRRTVRTVTPGTIVDAVDDDPRYLASVFLDGDTVGLSFTNIRSGQILVTNSTRDEYIDAISVYRPVEVIVTSSGVETEQRADIESEISDYMNTRIEQYKHSLSEQTFQQRVQDQFGTNVVSSIGLSASDACVCSAGVTLAYLDDTIPQITASLTQLRTVGDDAYAHIDARTKRSLELTSTIHADTGNSLFAILDKTVTTNGKERLKQYLQRPLSSVDRIERRQTAVTAFIRSATTRQRSRQILSRIPDLGRVATKCSYGSATPRELRAIADGLGAFTELASELASDPLVADTHLCSRIAGRDESTIAQIREQIDTAVRHDPTDATVDEQGTIAPGHDAELDAILDSYQENKQWFDGLDERFKTQTGLTHVTVDRNKTDGYYIQVGRSEADTVSRDTYDEIKQLKNSKRFKDDEMRSREREFLRLEERKEQREAELIASLRDEIASYAETLQEISSEVAHVDAVLSLAAHAVTNNWTQPTLTDEQQIDITDGRHPVVEQNVDFTANSARINEQDSFLIVTGPNMSGKSTYLRQTALITLLAQVGSYVPAADAKIGVRDAIFTRVGAMDEISRGRSTFMVEMAELANILHSSTDDSLVILDEVGRGTATSDGISIARSTVEYLSGNTDDSQTPLTLFATHYHQLTGLVQQYDTLRNVHVAAEAGQPQQDSVFAREVKDGPADESYGIRVARMAGVPEPVIQRSEEILRTLRGQNNHTN